MAVDPIEMILLRQWASYIAVPTWITDTQGRLIFFNESVEGIIGLRFDEADELPAEDLADRFAMCEVDGTPINNEDRPLMIALHKLMPAHRRIGLRSNGAMRELEVTAIPIITEGERHLGAMATIWDHTGVDRSDPFAGPDESSVADVDLQRPIETILARHWASYLTVPVWLMDASGWLIYGNPAAEVLTGIEVTDPVAAERYVREFNASDIDGKPLSIEEQPGTIALVNRVAAHREMRAQDRDGMWRHIEVTGIPLIGQGNRVHGAVAMFWEVDR